MSAPVTADPAKKPTWISPRDLLEVLRLPVMAGVAWTLPSGRWDDLARAAVALHLRLAPSQQAARRRARESLFGRSLSPAALDQMIAGSIADTYRARMVGLREYWPRGRNPKIAMAGLDHIEQGLNRGHGVLLWVAPFVYSHLMTKKGLHAAGVHASHLSRPEHGFSPTRFGIRVLNPICTRIEDRYLFERVRFDETADSGAALSRLRERLAANQVVSITVGAKARRTVEVDCLAATLSLATGPIHLALTSGAALLPVFTVRSETGEFVVTVEPPLIGADDARDGELYQTVAQRYVRRLEPFALSYPSQAYQALGLE